MHVTVSAYVSVYVSVCLPVCLLAVSLPLMSKEHVDNRADAEMLLFEHETDLAFLLHSSSSTVLQYL